MDTKTTQELAQLYKTNSNTLTVNFKRHPEKFQEGEHYILEGKSYQWTKEGAFLHARYLNTDEAWEGYKTLKEEDNQLEVLVKLQQAHTDLLAKYELLQEKYNIMRTAYVTFIQGIAAKRMPYTAEDMVDGTIIIHRLTQHFLDLKRGEKNPQPIYQKILDLLKQIDKQWTHTQDYLEEHYYEMTGAQVEISNTESLIRDLTNEFKTLSSPIELPLLESPR